MQTIEKNTIHGSGPRRPKWPLLAVAALVVVLGVSAVGLGFAITGGDDNADDEIATVAGEPAPEEPAVVGDPPAAAEAPILADPRRHRRPVASGGRRGPTTALWEDG